MGVEGFAIFGMFLAVALATLIAVGRHRTTHQISNFVAARIRPLAAPCERQNPKGDDTHG